MCVIDDVWASVGSDNFNLRSWTHDSELSCAVLDEREDPRPPSGASRYARDLRLALMAEHLDLPADGPELDELCDPAAAFDAFAGSAARLESWHAAGRTGPRPPGRLRPHPAPELSRVRRALALPLYRIAVDPDGRPSGLRRSRRF